MSEQKSFLDDLANAKPESFKEEVFVSTKRNYKKFIIIIGAIFLTLIILFLLRRTTDVVLPDMTGWQLEKIQSWVKKNHENTTFTGVYTLEYPVNTFISGDVPVGQKIAKGHSLAITYSLGGDPIEPIDLVNFKALTLQEVKAWIDENKLTGITIKYENSEVVPKDAVISYEIIDGTAETFLRKNRITLYISKGNQSTTDPFAMPDFMGKSEGEVIQWADEQQIEVIINKTFNPSVEFGKVFKQSIKKETKITQKDTVTISLSLGAPIEVPDFTGFSRTEASELAALYGLSVFFKHQVSGLTLDSVISQDISAGSEIDKTQIVTLNIAKETLMISIPNFIGLTTTEATSLASLSDIKTFIKTKSSTEKVGTVISQSFESGKSIQQDQLLTLFVSSGQLIVPNFIGLTKNEATIAAELNALTLLFNETKTTVAPNNSVLSQSIVADTVVEADASIILEISVNTGVIGKDLTSMNKETATLWATQNNVSLIIIDQYSETHVIGTLYGQTYLNEIVPNTESMTIYHSLGRVGVVNFVGKTKLDIINWQNEVNSKGANITLSFASENNTTQTMGTITNQSVKSDLIKLNETITVWVSTTDSGIKIPNLDNLDEAAFKLWCSNNSILYIIMDTYSNHYGVGKVFNQNYVHTYLPKGEFLRIYRSLGKVVIGDFTNQTKAAVLSWQKQANALNAYITIEFSEAYSDTIVKGNILDQSIKNSEISMDETITITVSLGPTPVVEDAN